MPHRTPSADEPVLVACLCAAWCQTCDAYRAVFDAVGRAHGRARFVWVDIEDHSDALDEGEHGAPDIANFPTLLLLQGGQPRFFGPVLPHANVLERLLAQAGRHALPGLRDPATVALGRAVGALAASGALD